MFPIYTTEFWRFLATLDPQHDIPFAKYMSSTAIPALYEKTRELVANCINKAKYFAATGRALH